MLVRGDKAFAGHSRSWSLGKWRVFVNGGALIFALVTGVVFTFPPFLPVTGTTMNYAVVVLAIVAIMAGAVWLTDGRKNFYGPRDIEERLQTNKNS